MSMSLDDLSDKLTSSIKGVVYHIAGHPSDVERIAMSIEITLIEDCNNAIEQQLTNVQ